MAYIPFSQRSAAAPPSGGGTAVADKPPALAVTQPPAQPALSVVNSQPNATIAPPGFIGPLRPVTTPGPAIPAVPTVTQKPVASPLQGSGVQPQITSPTEDFQSTISSKIFQPSSSPQGYTPVDLRVTGVNGTPAPVPIYTMGMVNGKTEAGIKYVSPEQVPTGAQIAIQPTEAKQKANYIDFISQSSTGDLLKRQFGDNALTKVAGFVYDLGLDPITKDLSDISVANKVSQGVAKGEIDPSVFDGMDTLKKTAPQIFGDVAQAVLLAYTPSLGVDAVIDSAAKDSLQKSLIQLGKVGIKEGGFVGAQFGVAQAFSSGSTNPDELAKIILANTVGGAALGGVLHTGIPAIAKVVSNLNEIKNSFIQDLVKKGYTLEEAKNFANQGGFLGKFSEKINPKAEELGRKINELNKRFVENPTPSNKKALDLAKKLYKQETQGGFIKIGPEQQADILKRANDDWTVNYAPQVSDFETQIADLQKQMDTPKAQGYVGDRENAYIKGEINFLERKKTALQDEFVNNWRKESGLPPEIKSDVLNIPKEIQQSQTPMPKDEQSTALSGSTEPGQFRFPQTDAYENNINPDTGNVVPPAVRGGIQSPELNLKLFKDKATFSLARETFERNIDAVAATPADAAKLKEFVVDPVRANEDALVKYIDPLKKETKATMEDLGIKAGSKEDSLVQRFGEKNMTSPAIEKAVQEAKDSGTEISTEQWDKLQKEALQEQAPKTWQKIEQGSQYFRNKYDELLGKVNASRTKFGYDPIPARTDYFRHFQEIGNIIQNLGFLFREQDLPTGISGLTDVFKPGKPFSTAELQRKGGPYTESAAKGFSNYLDSIGKQIFHIDSVQRVRALEKYIRLAGDEGQTHLPAFVANLNEYGNLLAGKAAKLDRAAESVIGRRIFGAAKLLKNETGVSLVGGNIASALTNFIPFTQSLATTEKIPALKGLLDSLISPFTQDLTHIDGVESSFLLRRYRTGDIAPSFRQKFLDKAGSLFSAIDKFTSHSIVAGKYYEGLADGLGKEEAIKAADTYAGKVLTDRSYGQLPNIFQNKSLGFVTQFQTEVNNMASFLTKDIPKMSAGSKTKLVSAFSQFFLYSYLFNTGYQEVTGRRPTLDPIYAGLTLLGQTEASKHMPFGQRAQTAGTDIAGNLPFGNLIPGLSQGGRFPIASFFPDMAKLSQGDLTELLNPVSLQLKKTIQGLNAFNKGEVDTPKGKTKFKIDQTPANFARSALFGQYSSPQAQDYFNNGSNPVKPKGLMPTTPKLPKFPKLPKLPSRK